MCTKGSASHWWLSMSYLNILLQVEVVVHYCILHDHCMPAATLLLHYYFPVEDCAQSLLLCVCLCCVNSRWSTWVVIVGAPRKIFKPHFQISRLGLWTVCSPIYNKGLFIGLFYDDVVNCIFLR